MDKKCTPVGFFKSFGNFSGNVDRWHYYYLYMPSIAVIDFGSANTSCNLNEDERHKGVRVFTVHFVTPVSETECIDRWMHLRNTEIDNEEVSRKMDEMFRLAFNEDKVVLEAIQQEESMSYNQQTISLAIDKAPNVYRLRIKRMIENELNKNRQSSY